MAMTTLEAVNMCLVAINEFRVVALDTNGISTAADAERYVNESTRYFCAMGWPGNTRKAARITPVWNGTEYVINIGQALPATTIRIKGTGPDSHRSIVLRDIQAYDADNGTINFGNTNQVFLDIAELLPFTSLEPILQEEISQHAAQRFARRMVGGQITDAYLSQEIATTDSLQPRQGLFPSKQLFAPPGQQQQQ